MNQIINQLIIGLRNGSIYALVALGYTMVYGIIKLINFAHGDFIMVGAYMIYTFAVIAHLPIVLSIVLAIFAVVILGILTEKIAYKPLRESPSITALITAIAVSLLLENVFELIFTSNAKTPSKILDLPPITIGSFSIDSVSVITFALAIVTIIALTLFVKKTTIGTAMRAVSENKDASKLMGININKIITITFAIGTLLAGIAALMYYTEYPQIKPYLGSELGLYAFVAAVVGGIGVIHGACIGGFLIGIIKVLPSIFHIDSVYADIFLFGLLIIILIFKPNGLFGKKVGEKV